MEENLIQWRDTPEEMDGQPWLTFQMKIIGKFKKKYQIDNFRILCSVQGYEQGDEHFFCD